jgi:hypothetical protein
VAAKGRKQRIEPDLDLTNQVEQVATLRLEGPALRLPGFRILRSAILVFAIYQSVVSLIFRCKKQRKQRGAAEGDLFAKGQSGMLPATHPAVPLPTRSSAQFGETDCGNLACCPDFKVSHNLVGDFVVAPVPDALPSLIVRRGDASARRCGGCSSNSDYSRRFIAAAN